MPLDDYLIEALRMAPSVMGAGSLGRGASKTRRVVKRTPHEERMAEAQANATRDLYMPPDNTAMDRADILGFNRRRPYFIGAMKDIEPIDLSRSSGTNFAGRGVYAAPNPLDASGNYASIYGPNPSGRLLDLLMEGTPPPLGTMRKFLDKSLTPEEMEQLYALAGKGHYNLGTVYPVYMRHGLEANIADTSKSSGWIEPRYGSEGGRLTSTGDPKWHEARRILGSYGADVPKVLREAEAEGRNAGEFARDLQRQVHGRTGQLWDPRTRQEVGAPTVATDVLRALGVDTLTHGTGHWGPPLNLSKTHTIALRPEIVRSRYAAFDPVRRNENNLLGAATPAFLGTVATGTGASIAALRSKKKSEDERNADFGP